jgi:Uncharacterized protein conserved in bacteria (DUF2321)
MLSDACFEFLDSLRDAARVLAQQSAWCVDSPLGYGEEIDAVLVACREVESPKPWNEEAAVRLIKLAGSVLRYHDSFPGSPHYAARLARMNALVGIVRSDLGDAEANEVAALVSDLASDMPKGESAAMRLKPILLRLGKAGYDMAMKIITDVASEVVKKALGL